VCIALCTIVAHNTAQNRPGNFPSYTPDNHHCSTDVWFEGRGTHPVLRQLHYHFPVTQPTASKHWRKQCHKSHWLWFLHPTVGHSSFQSGSSQVSMVLKKLNLKQQKQTCHNKLKDTNNTIITKTKKFGCLVRHPVWKRIGPITAARGPTQGQRH